MSGIARRLMMSSGVAVDTSFGFREGKTSTSQNTTQTFDNVYIGQPFPRRRVFIMLSWTGTTGDASIDIHLENTTISCIRSSGKSGSFSTSSSYVFLADVSQEEFADIEIKSLGNVNSNGTPSIVVFSGAYTEGISLLDAEVDTANIIISGGSGHINTKSTVENGVLLTVLSHGTGGSEISISDLSSELEIVHQSPTNFPFYFSSLSPTIQGNTSLQYTWSGSPTNSSTTFAFQL